MKKEKNNDSSISLSRRNKISKELEKRLGPEFISYRPGFGGSKVAYIEGWTAIALANKIFGYDGWSSEIKNMNIDYMDVENKKVSIGVSCVIRITLQNGNYKEDVGFGSSENQRFKSEAYQKAKKEAATDALKRALRQFGNCLGNCCYDKEFLKDIQKITKQENHKIDTNNLFRRYEF
ncbi:DNA repair and recombination protein Rad52, partial [Hamiltosporidium magnivora]